MAKKQATAVLKFDDIKIIWRTIVQSWYVPFILVPVFYLVGYFVSYREFETYEVVTQLLLKSNDQYYKGNIIDDNSDYYGSVYGSYVDNSNEGRVIKSYDLIEEVVRKLKPKIQVSYYIVGRVRTAEQFTGMPFSVYVNNMNPGFYERKFGLKILDNKSYEISYKEGEKEEKKRGEFDKELITLNFNLLIAKNVGLTEEYTNEVKNLQYEFLSHSLETLVASFQSKLKIGNPEFTNVLTVSHEDNLIERSKLFLDTLCQVYINNTLKTRIELNERTIQYIDKQMADISAIVKYFEDTMQNYKSSKAILDLGREEGNYYSKLTAFENQRVQFNLQIAAANDLEKYIIEGQDPQFLPPSAFVTGSADGFLAKEAAHLYTLQTQLNEARNFATEKNFSLTQLENTIKKTKTDLLVYISNNRTATNKTIDHIDQEIASYITSIKTIPQKQRDLLGIQRQLGVNEGLYNFLLQKRANANIARASILAETKVIESPRPSGKVYPDKKKIIMQYVFAGAIISVLIILIRFFFFTTIQNVLELKELTSTPVIGDLVFVKKMAPVGIVVDEEPKSHIAESFRTLRTNLQYLNTMPGPKVILLTSNAPGEGKTFCSINLATMLAKAGKRVLLLELDLHKPRVQKALAMTAETGISTIVVKQNTIEECIRHTKIEKLDVLLSGPIPPNPSEMVLSNEMKEIINYGKSYYDYVLIDTPPAGLISDSIYLMQYADISLFVLNTKFANKAVVHFIDELVETNQIKNFAYVLNGVKRRRSGYYYTKYSYRYGAGYGYGYYGYGYGYGGSNYGTNYGSRYGGKK